MCIPTVLEHGTEMQRRELVPATLRGDLAWAQLFSEPDAGSDLPALRTRAVREGNDWVISGEKVWSSDCQYCDVGLLITRTGSPDSRHRGLTAFVLDLRTPGVTLNPIMQMTGLPKFCSVTLDEVRLPDAARLGPVDGGWGVVLTTITAERVSVGTSPHEARRMGTAADLVVAAETVGRGTDPAVRRTIAELRLGERVVHLLSRRVRIAAAERGGAFDESGSIAKLAMSSLVARIAGAIMDVQGLSGIAWDPDAAGGDEPALRYLTAPGMLIGGGSLEIQRNTIAERVLGLPREPRATLSPKEVS